MRGIKQAALKDDVELQPHQQDAVEHLKDKPGGIINHSLGSGKTVTSLGISEEQSGNTLAVTPAALRENFKKEIDKFVPDDRKDAYKVTSYHKFRNEADDLIDEHEPNTVIADEVHRLRNPTQARDAFIRNREKFPHMLGLTGTLSQNHPSEVVPLSNLATGKKLMGKRRFNREHIKEVEENPGLWGKYIKGVEPGVREEITNKEGLRDTFSPYIHRFTGSEEYEKHTPDVEEEVVETGLSSKQKKLLKQLEKNNPAAAYRVRANLPPSKKDSENLNAFMIGARQIANTPASHDVNVDDPVEESPKLQQMLEDAKDSEKTVQFSNFLDAGVYPTVDRLQEEDVDAGVYEGSMSDKKKKELIQKFNESDEGVLGLSPAGGEGLDLKGVRQMQITEPDWNPEKINQAIGRAARYKSHDHLPEDEQKVKVRRYKATEPEKWYHNIPGVDKKTSIDEYISNRAQEKERLNEGLYDALPEFEG